jgi:hypothetical protein
MTLLHICQWLYDSPFGTSIRESDLVFDLIESAHVLGISLMAGTVAFVDLRLLGLVLKNDEVSDVLAQVLPLTWAGFGLMVTSGLLLFWSEASKMYFNPMFRLKLVLLALAGLNPLIFHQTVFRGVEAWDSGAAAPRRAKMSAIASLTLWSAIIVAGRAIAYFHTTKG